MIENFSPQTFPLWLAEERGTEVLLVIGWQPVRVGRVDRLVPVAVPYGSMGQRPALVDSPYALYATYGGAEIELERRR